MDWLPTFLAAAGKDGTKKDLLDGYRSKALVSQRCPAGLSPGRVRSRRSNRR